MNKDYTIMGCITKYNIDDIRPFVESIQMSGFKGKKVMMVYDIGQEVIDYLKEREWEVYGSELQEHIIIQRFRDIYKLLDNFLDDVIIWMDVKDVIFQKDPTEWLEKHKKKEILSFSECIILKDDEWACVNTGTPFPLEWEWAKDNPSYCAGTMVADGFALRDLFIEIYHWSRDTSNKEQLSDQAAYNILINLNHFQENVQFVQQEEGFITQLGTVLIKKDVFGDKLLEPTPQLNDDGTITNQNGTMFCVVHQYDRDPKLKELYLNKYK